MEVSLQIDAEGRSASDHTLDYSTRIFATRLSEAALEALRSDVVVADCALLPRTFFIDATAEPRCLFEAVAVAIAKCHAPKAAWASTGAEWWVQKRPQGRAQVLHPTSGDAAERIDWHVSLCCFGRPFGRSTRTRNCTRERDCSCARIYRP